MKRSTILVVVLLSTIGLFGHETEKQSKEKKTHGKGMNLTVQVQMGLPQSEFRAILDGYMAGGSFSLSKDMGNSGLLRIGGEYAWNSLGDSKTFVELWDDASNVFGGQMNAQTDVRNYLGYIRLSPFDGGFRPYGDAILGVRSFQSGAMIEVEDLDGTTNSTVVSLDRQFKSTYGFAFGAQVALTKNFFMDGKVQVLRGGRITYIDNDSLQIDTDGSIDYSLRISDTDILIPNLGLSLFF